MHIGGQNLPKKINIHVPQFGTLGKDVLCHWNKNEIDES